MIGVDCLGRLARTHTPRQCVRETPWIQNLCSGNPRPGAANLCNPTSTTSLPPPPPNLCGLNVVPLSKQYRPMHVWYVLDSMSGSSIRPLESCEGSADVGYHVIGSVVPPQPVLLLLPASTPAPLHRCCCPNMRATPSRRQTRGFPEGRKVISPPPISGPGSLP